MSAAKHTPGPWEISRLATPDYAPQYAVYAGPGPSVAVVVQGNSEANAHLIAAAPELLEALEKIAQINPYDTSSMGYVVALASAAIAKATGVGL